jgi:hypothetical protein
VRRRMAPVIKRIYEGNDMGRRTMADGMKIDGGDASMERMIWDINVRGGVHRRYPRCILFLDAYRELQFVDTSPSTINFPIQMSLKDRREYRNRFRYNHKIR